MRKREKGKYFRGFRERERGRSLSAVMADPLKPSWSLEEEWQFRNKAPVPLSFQVHNSGFWIHFFFSPGLVSIRVRSLLKLGYLIFMPLLWCQILGRVWSQLGCNWVMDSIGIESAKPGSNAALDFKFWCRCLMNLNHQMDHRICLGGGGNWCVVVAEFW